MFGCHLWFSWRPLNWPQFPFFNGFAHRRRRGNGAAEIENSTKSQQREESKVLTDSLAMSISQGDAMQQQPSQQKLNVELFDIIEKEDKTQKAASIPTTPEDPSPSCSISWPVTASTSIFTITTTATATTETVVTVHQSIDSASIVSIDTVDSGAADRASSDCCSTGSNSLLTANSAVTTEDAFNSNDGWCKKQKDLTGQARMRILPEAMEGSIPVDGESQTAVNAPFNGPCDQSKVDVVNEMTPKPAPIAISQSRSSESMISEEDLLQASASTVIAAPVGAVLRNYSASGAAATVTPGHSDAPLHSSVSTGHLAASDSNSPSASKNRDPRHHPHQHSNIFLTQFSDSESIGSNESMHDLASAVNSDPSYHRQISGGSSAGSGSGSGTGYYRGQSAGSALRTSNYGVQNALLHHPHVASTSAAAAAAMRALSHTALATLDDDLASASRSAVTAYDFQHSHLHGTAKHLHTEQVVSKHTLKAKLNKFQRLLDKAFVLINMGTEESIIEGCGVVAKVMVNAWVAPKIGHDLAYGLCDYLREMTYFDLLLHFLLNLETKQRVRLAAGRALEECLSAPNRDYMACNSASEGSGPSHRLERFVQVIKSFKDGEELRVAVSLLESLFKQSAQTNSRLIELSALDYVLNACKATTNSHTLRHAALALANLSMYSDNECQQRMIGKNVPDWLFLLASSQDDVTRYYACLAICVLVSNKEIESSVIKSGTLSLVEPFLLAHKPADFATSDYKHCQGRPMQWLAKLVPVLNAKRRESRSMAAFHFAMEAGIKKDQEALGVFEQIGAVEALKQVAALPEEVAPKFASIALEIVGEEVPYKLSHQVPLWSIEDVQYWVTHIGFEKFANSFCEQKVDGDLLLLISDCELANDIGMKSGLLRKRFMRELESLKMAADYSCVDETQLDRFLVSVNPHFSVYTYRLLEMGVDRSILPSISDEMMKTDCGISNPVHRAQLLQSLQEFKHIDDLEISMLSRHIDIFISYRRSTGNQLASLIKVLLQLRGYKVFIDVDRLYAGKFDSSLLKNIQAAKHFVLVLTPHALDRCVDDDDCSDWVHKEVFCALEHNKNIIPVFDPQFEWPENHLLPGDIRGVTRFNGVRWVHEYQEACVDKLEKFIEGEVNIDRGFTSPQRSQQSQHSVVGYRSASKSNSGPGNQQLANAPDAADLVLEALTAVGRGRSSSHDQLSQQ